MQAMCSVCTLLWHFSKYLITSRHQDSLHFLDILMPFFSPTLELFFKNMRKKDYNMFNGYGRIHCKMQQKQPKHFVVYWKNRIRTQDKIACYHVCCACMDSFHQFRVSYGRSNALLFTIIYSHALYWFIFQPVLSHTKVFAFHAFLSNNWFFDSISFAIT